MSEAPLRRDRWADVLPTAPADGPSMRLFGLVMLGGMGGLAALLVWRRGAAAGPVPFLLAGIGGVILLWSLVAPTTLRPVYRAWMRLGEGMGHLVATVALTAIFVLVLTPLGAVMRGSGTDPLRRRRPIPPGGLWRRSPAMDRTHYDHLS